jgi:uncharacterized membrane protein YgcG
MNYLLIILSFIFFSLVPLPAKAQAFPEMPPYGEYISDNAGVLDRDTAQQINSIASHLFEDEGITLYVVTLSALRDYEGSGMSVPEYTWQLYQSWAKNNDNEIMVLLFSLGDDYMQIRLKPGAGKIYGNKTAQGIFDKLIYPPFYEDQYALALLEGVSGLDKMARGEKIPRVDVIDPFDAISVIIIVLGLCAFVVVLRQRSSPRR